MTQADRVLSTPPTNTSPTLERNPPREALAESVDSFSPQLAMGQPESETRTGESPKYFEAIARRSVLAALAFLPAALPIASVAGADPVFGLIEAHRAAVRAWNAALALQQRLEEAGDWDSADQVAEKPCHGAHDAFQTLVAEPAATARGLHAKLAYFEELLANHETNWTIDECVQPSVLFNSLAASLRNIGWLA